MNAWALKPKWLLVPAEKAGDVMETTEDIVSNV